MKPTMLRWRQAHRAAAVGSIVVLAATSTRLGVAGVAIAVGLAVCAAIMWAVASITPHLGPKTLTRAQLGAGVATVVAFAALRSPLLSALGAAVLGGLFVRRAWLRDRWPDLLVCAGLVVLAVAGSGGAHGMAVVAWLVCAVAAVFASVRARTVSARRPLAAAVGRRTAIERQGWLLGPLILALIAGPLLARLLRQERPEQGNRRPVPRTPQPSEGTGALERFMRWLSEHVLRRDPGEAATGGAAPVHRSPNWLLLLVLVLVAVLVALLVWWLLRRRRRGRGRGRAVRPAPGWDEVMIGRVDRLGRRAGRPRAPQESLERYTPALASVLSVPDLADIGRCLAYATFSARGVPPEERQRIDATLAALEKDRRRLRRARTGRPVEFGGNSAPPPT